MNFDRPEYELLSAYLDGELDEAQKSQVEKLLAEDPVARRLLAELESLSRLVRQLPKHELTADLHDAVLAEAERRVLLGDAESGVSQPLSGDRQIAVREEPQRSSARWTILVAAAAVALIVGVVIVWQRSGEKQLARQDVHSRPTVPFSQSPARMAEEQSQDMLPGQSAERAEQLGGPALGLHDKAFSATEKTSQFRSLSSADVQAATPAVAAPAAPAGDSRARIMALESAPSAGVQAQRSAPGARTQNIPPPQINAFAPSEGHPAEPADEDELEQLLKLAESDHNWLVVYCQVRDEGVKNGTLRNLLRALALTPVTEPEDLAVEPTLIDRSAKQPTEEKQGGKSSAQPKAVSRQFVIDARISESQLKMLLNQLQQRPDKFPVVAVQVVPPQADEEALKQRLAILLQQQLVQLEQLQATIVQSQRQFPLGSQSIPAKALAVTNVPGRPKAPGQAQRQGPTMLVVPGPGKEHPFGAGATAGKKEKTYRIRLLLETAEEKGGQSGQSSPPETLPAE